MPMEDALFIIMMVPITAIIGGIGSSIMKRWMAHKEEMARLNNGNSFAPNAEIESLRRELAQLRDTTTRYDMSVEHNMNEMKQRIEFLEGQRRTYQSPMIKSEETNPQTVKLGE